MSTICKLDRMVRHRRTQRANLLRNPPRLPRGASSTAHAEFGAIMAEMFMISRSPRLNGDTKHNLFVRGASQISQLK